jgi:hypothetical protein
MNYFSGYIPSEMGQLTQLQVCNMDINFLSGSIPTELAYATRLNAMKFSTNVLTGALPREIFAALTNMDYLDLAANFLSGAIPNEVDQLTHLEQLMLAQNYLTGTIPSVIGRLSELQVLDVAWNDLSGTLPWQIASLEELQQLAVHQNANLYGRRVVQELVALEHLSALYITGTLLSGTVPSELCTIELNMTCSDFLCGCDCPCLDMDDGTTLTPNTTSGGSVVESEMPMPLLVDDDDIPLSKMVQW